MELHVISPGSINPQTWMDTAVKIQAHVDFLHIREPSWSKTDLRNVLQEFSNRNGLTDKVIVNTKTPGSFFWQGLFHYPEAEMQKVTLKKGGVSVHSLAAAQRAEEIGASYLVFGPVYSPFSKPGVMGAGTDELNKITQTVSLPVIAVGGISPERLPEVRAAGAAGAAAISAVFLQKDPVQAAQNFRKQGGN
ncbi:thiamine phosphate synthase [Alkalicoccus daliensis]|uniref:Thiazole tautomerase (Transcriptional regulator TenI) n=1 Tax=Alkalicoccus daliensis TaxID=745820 RepID=A0A1H0DZD1_9BACI|nr:thiamine phosphate synthase [Alkalicoccus daliensis]SDN75510.1 thiazole tautomerase (transcriptional regulator TenI) [Alkalicoccus daliensis]